MEGQDATLKIINIYVSRLYTSPVASSSSTPHPTLRVLVLIDREDPLRFLSLNITLFFG
jgi:hypothetical protein